MKRRRPSSYGIEIMNRSARISYFVLAAAIVLVVWLHLGTLLLSSLFGYLALQLFSFRSNKVVSVALSFLVAIVVAAGLFYFASLAYRTLPSVADTAIPAMVDFAEKHGIDLPFTDYASLKATALAAARQGFAIIGKYAGVVSFQSLLLVAGSIVGLSLFLNPYWIAGDHPKTAEENLYSQVTRELSLRFRSLYRSFATIMSAQILISSINTVLTAIFLFLGAYPYAALLLCLVFLCGLIPILGNLASNAIIVGVGFTMSPRSGLIALIFLVLIHKLEYFLDSMIIGRRIHSPVWLMLIALLLGERLMGIPGMVLAPVVLYFIKCEASAHRSNSETRPRSECTHAFPRARSIISTARPNG